MKKYYQLSLPGEKVIEKNAADCEGGTDELIKELLERKMTGYLRIEADPLMGFALFKNGALEEGFFLNEKKIVSSSINALIDFRQLCEKGGKIWIVDLPEKMLLYAKIMHMGTNILPVSEVKKGMFNSIYKEFKDKISSGLLIVNSRTGKSAVIHISDSKWKLQMSKDEFTAMLGEEGTIMALFDYNEENLNERIAETAGKKEAEPEPDPNVMIKKKILEFIEANYQDRAQKLREKIEAADVTPEKLPGILEEIEEFVRFFIDDENIEQKITVLKEVINHLD